MATRRHSDYSTPGTRVSRLCRRILRFRDKESEASDAARNPARGAKSTALLSGKALSGLPLPATAVLQRLGVSPTQPGRASLTSSAELRAPRVRGTLLISESQRRILAAIVACYVMHGTDPYLLGAAGGPAAS
jgi:hypothetical protein